MHSTLMLHFECRRNYKVYHVFGFFLLVFLELLAVTLCVAIVGTYFLLNSENYNW